MRRSPGVLPRLAFAGLVVGALVAGIAGGLVRAGVAVPVAGAAVAAHALLGMNSESKRLPKSLDSARASAAGQLRKLPSASGASSKPYDAS